MAKRDCDGDGRAPEDPGLNLDRRPPVPAQERQNAGLGLDSRYWLSAERSHLLLKEGKRLTDRLVKNQDQAPGPAIETTKHY